jgi:hypothetical protein
MFRRRLQQGRVIRVAADDPMHGDDISRFDPIGEDSEVSDDGSQAVGYLTRLGFAAGGVEIGRGRIDERG